MGNLIQRIYNYFQSRVQYEVHNETDKSSIVSYDIKYLLTIGWLLPRHGSVFTPIQQILITGFFAGLVTVLANFSCQSPDDQTFCVPLPAPNTSYLTLSTLCSFVVAFFANTVISRWWNVRFHIGRVTGRSNVLLASICAAFTASINNAKEEEVGERIVLCKLYCYKIRGYLALGCKLLLNLARDTRDISDLVERRLISPEDAEYFSKLSGQPQNAYELLSRVLQQATASGLVDNTNANLLKFEGDLTFISSHVQMIICYLDTQLSYPFVQIFTAVCYAFLVQLVYVCASFVAEGLRKKDKPSYTTGYLTIILYSFVLLGLLKLAEVLENPLGHDSADLPCNTYLTKLENAMKSSIENSFRILEKNEPILQWMNSRDRTNFSMSPRSMSMKLPSFKSPSILDFPTPQQSKASISKSFYGSGSKNRSSPVDLKTQNDYKSANENEDASSYQAPNIFSYFY